MQLRGGENCRRSRTKLCASSRKDRGSGLSATPRLIQGGPVYQAALCHRLCFLSFLPYPLFSRSSPFTPKCKKPRKAAAAPAPAAPSPATPRPASRRRTAAPRRSDPPRPSTSAPAVSSSPTSRGTSAPWWTSTSAGRSASPAASRWAALRRRGTPAPGGVSAQRSAARWGAQGGGVPSGRYLVPGSAFPPRPPLSMSGDSSEEPAVPGREPQES